MLWNAQCCMPTYIHNAQPIMPIFCWGQKARRASWEARAAVWSELMSWKQERILSLLFYSHERGPTEEERRERGYSQRTCIEYTSASSIRNFPYELIPVRTHPDRFGLIATLFRGYCSSLHALGIYGTVCFFNAHVWCVYISGPISYVTWRATSKWRPVKKIRAEIATF